MTRQQTQPRAMPWWERWIGDHTGDVLAWLAKRALDRGDRHEFEHLRAAVMAGNSSHSERWPCSLRPSDDAPPVDDRQAPDAARSQT